MYGSILVSMLLEKFSGVRTRIAGGDGVGDGGIVTPEGMKGHYWVVANVHGMHFIVDITADQFGMDSIIYKGLKDAPEYVEGHQALVDEHVADSFHKLFQATLQRIPGYEPCQKWRHHETPQKNDAQDR
jgi:hypothetical protein